MNASAKSTWPDASYCSPNNCFHRARTFCKLSAQHSAPASQCHFCHDRATHKVNTFIPARNTADKNNTKHKVSFLRFHCTASWSRLIHLRAIPSCDSHYWTCARNSRAFKKSLFLLKLQVETIFIIAVKRYIMIFKIAREAADNGHWEKISSTSSLLFCDLQKLSLHRPVLSHNLRQQPAFASQGPCPPVSAPPGLLPFLCHLPPEPVKPHTGSSWAACLYPLDIAGSYLFTASSWPSPSYLPASGKLPGVLA